LKTKKFKKMFWRIQYLFVIAVTNTQQSSHQAIVNKSSIIPATCEYSYDSDNVYTCRLYVSGPVTSTDALEITGTHLDNHTDADVQAVVEFFNGDVLRKFENLKSIIMLGGGLMEINPNAFDVCPKLEKLSLVGNELKTFPSGLLRNCVNLARFEVINMKVISVPENLFGMTRNLESFTLIGNLTSLPERLLQNMEKLRYLNIGSNRLTELSSNFLINAPNLQEFTAHVNKFKTQTDITYALNGRTNLKVLRLQGNDFDNFDFRFFTQFQKLETLFIGSSGGPQLTDISWQSLPSSLISLIVNGIGENIPKNSFNNLEKLEFLTMTGFGIEKLHKDTFKPLTKLNKLFIEGTTINSLPSGLFANQINLIRLEIEGSQIYRLNGDSFGDHPQLQDISFAFNKINAIQRGIFSKFHPTLKYVDFWSNECTSENFYGENLDQDERLSKCFINWERLPDTPPIITTTPSGCGKCFVKFEFLFIIIFIYFLE